MQWTSKKLEQSSLQCPHENCGRIMIQLEFGLVYGQCKNTSIRKLDRDHNRLNQTETEYIEYENTQRERETE